ncbi:hypothetical protein BV25DRAFT_1366146 [Artomyces pyxidatus]|uniref:Uncharacterized protein n=1 Tax=Artomyces pyxidatus TaxID=48021 RepID=A0ACB8SMS2_9AGAM|nr:hypothetical protein BV25DRAFT_1366146 [Artomyces pyxidatus]
MNISAMLITGFSLRLSLRSRGVCRAGPTHLFPAETLVRRVPVSVRTLPLITYSSLTIRSRQSFAHQVFFHPSAHPMLGCVPLPGSNSVAFPVVW